ncbi:14010_t:CDS:10 [Funneliformis caledonium]|uniref:14010_t:CDS:1 n=1 Tax=Funneliformis caledonium TaxID=1117310 RepID=A0A9N8YV42_9GLOM|nr:14010_t:CDS:10 [Funneliformis caledonium]
MATLRQKWAIHKNYRKIQTCWHEYRSVSDKDDVQLMIQKLENFLDIFQEAYKEWSASGIIIPTDFSLDKLYGDCSEVLKPDPGVERVADLVNKALNVAELILKDEKYRQLVANTPNLICRILLLLEKLNTTEAKKLTLRVISTLGENDLNKIEIGRHQGFKKILRLLIDDPDLTSEIVRTIKHFLEVRDEDIQKNGLRISDINKKISKRQNYINSNRNVDIGEKLKGENLFSQYDSFDSDFNEEERDNVNTFFGSFVGGKVSSMVAEIRELVFTELGRVFPNLHALASEILVNHSDSLNDKRKLDKIKSTIPRFNLIKDSYNHNDDKLENIISNKSDLNGNVNIMTYLEDESSSSDSSSSDKRCSDDLDKYSETSASSVATNESAEEYMRVQGALRSLTNILSEGLSQSNMTSVSKLDIIETICKLLFRNTANQAEFRKMDGYTTIFNVLDQFPENGARERESFLKDCFNVFFIISLDGSEDMVVGNVDALNLIFRTIVSSSQLDVRQYALNCIQDLITINCLNVVAAWKVGGVDTLIMMLNSAIRVNESINDLFRVLKLKELSQASLETFADIRYDITAVDPNSPSLFSAKSPVAQAVDLNPIFRYLVAVTRSLEYMAVILSENNSYILKEYTRILMEICLPSKSIVVNIILRSVSRLLTDLLSRNKDVEKNLLSIYLQFIRDIFQMSKFDGLASDLSNRVESEIKMDPTLNELDRVVIAEQNLLLLHIVGLLVDATGRNMELFEALQGFETLHDAIVLSSSCVECVNNDINLQVGLDIQDLSIMKDYPGLDEDIMVADMALWLLREYIVCGLDCIESWMIKLTKYILANISKSATKSSNASEVDTIASSKPPVTIISSLLNPKYQCNSLQRPKRAIFPWLQTKVCNVVSSVLRKSDKAKQLFGEFGGLEVMLGIISHTQDMDVASAALVTVGDFFAGYEGVQQLLGNLFGYDGFLELILSSVTPIDKTCCEIVLEVATIGSISRSLSQCPVEADPFLISSDIMPFISGLLDPTPLFTELLKFTQKRHVGFNKQSNKQEEHKRNNNRATVGSPTSTSFCEGTKNGSSSSLNKVPFESTNENNLASFSNGTAKMSRSSSKSSTQLPSPTLAPTTRVERLKTEEIIEQSSKLTTRKRSNSRNLGGFGLNSNAVKSDSSTINDKLRNWVGIIFRDSDAAMMALKLLSHIADGNDEKLQHYYFNLLMMLMEVDPRNKELLCANRALKFVMEVLFVKGKCSNDFEPLRQHPPSYVDLIPALGAYDMTNSDVMLLFEAAYDPLSMFGHFLDGGSSHRRSNSSSGDSFSQSLPSPKNSTIKIDPFFIREIQMQMIYSIERISERMDPSCYFNFNGIDSVLQTAPLDKFPSIKHGYTLSMWIKVIAFFGDETGLLCYEDKSGTCTTFELYFKRMDRSDRYCLCVRTQHHTLPPEDFVFYGFDFQEIGIWHHIVFVHSKDSTSLIVDGSMIQSHNMFNYPKMTGKEKIVAVIGRRGKEISPCLQKSPNKESINSHFYGQIGSIYLFRGLWDEEISEIVFNRGPAYSKNYRLLGVENKEVMAIHPQSYLNIEQKSIIESEKSRKNSDSMSFTKTAGRMEGGCSVHATRSMRDIIEQTGRIDHCFQILYMDPQQQLVGLRTISNLLYKSPQNVVKFTERHGFDTIRRSLSKDHSVISPEHFYVLLDIVSDGVMKNNQMLIINIDPLRVVIDLLAGCKESVQLPVVRTLMDMLIDVPENLKTWRTYLGVDVLFDLIDNLPASLQHFTMRTLEVMILDLTVEELTKLFKYLEKDKWVNIEVKCDIVSMLYKIMTFDTQLVEKLRGLKALSLLMPFLEAPNEKFRITILKMMGILMSSNVKHSRGVLVKINGFDTMRLYLVKHQLSLEFTQVLIGIGINFYQSDPEFKNCSLTMLDRPIFKRSSPRSSEDSISRTMNKSTEELIYPETIYLIFDLLKVSENSELVFQVLTDIKRILTPVNMRCLWEQNWLEWVIVFLQGRSKIAGSTIYNQHILTMIDTIVQKMMVFDISRKNSTTSKAKGAIIIPQNLSDKNYSEKFMLRLIDILLSYFDKNPNVNTEISIYIFRNLGILYRYLDDRVITSVRRHFASTINILACHNNSTIRTSMKSSGLFKIRDNLIKDYNDLAPIGGNEFGLNVKV